jgi:hypothetical protein
MIAGLAAAACLVLGAAATSASASDASIKQVIKGYNPRILVAEGHVVSAIGEYEKTGEPRRVQTALSATIKVLRSLREKIAAQSAGKANVKAGKAKLIKGLTSVILAYQHLSTAFGLKKSSPTAAKEQAKKARLAIRAGRKQLREGLRLLE